VNFIIILESCRQSAMTVPAKVLTKASAIPLDCGERTGMKQSAGLRPQMDPTPSRAKPACPTTPDVPDSAYRDPGQVRVDQGFLD
jgi:hypothetical protein